MLSILIPTYNYNVFPLANEIHKQALKTGITFEVLIFDDASDPLFYIDEFIKPLKYIKYKKLGENIGRTAVRQQLAAAAKYHNLLFMDADTFPKNSDFLAKLIPFINTNIPFVFGGVVFQDNPPDKSIRLRWKYGTAREALLLEERLAQPYKSVISTCFLSDKELFLKINKQLQYKRYGMDILFSYLLKQANVAVQHIENPVYHFSLEANDLFIQKSKDAIDTSLFLVAKKLIPNNYKTLDIFHQKWKKIGLCSLAKISYTLFGRSMEKALISKNASLRLFDWYRYGYYCSKK